MEKKRISKDIKQMLNIFEEHDKEVLKIEIILNRAKEQNLETEVVYYALKEMRFNNAITPVMAMMSACKEYEIQ
jgi:hypothetical protein